MIDINNLEHVLPFLDSVKTDLTIFNEEFKRGEITKRIKYWTRDLKLRIKNPHLLRDVLKNHNDLKEQILITIGYYTWEMIFSNNKLDFKIGILLLEKLIKSILSISIIQKDESYNHIFKLYSDVKDAKLIGATNYDKILLIVDFINKNHQSTLNKDYLVFVKGL